MQQEVPRTEDIRLLKIQSVERRNTAQKNREVIDCAIAHFCQNVSRGPEYVCSVCHRLLFRKQVLECKPEYYDSKRADVASLAKRCITFQYLHVCDSECQKECCVAESPSSKLWICHTCNRKILGGKLPEECYKQYAFE